MKDGIFQCVAGISAWAWDICHLQIWLAYKRLDVEEWKVKENSYGGFVSSPVIGYLSLLLTWEVCMLLILYVINFVDSLKEVAFYMLLSILVEFHCNLRLLLWNCLPRSVLIGCINILHLIHPKIFFNSIVMERQINACCMHFYPGEHLIVYWWFPKHFVNLILHFLFFFPTARLNLYVCCWLSKEMRTPICRSAFTDRGHCYDCLNMVNLVFQLLTYCYIFCIAWIMSCLL